MQNTCSKCSAPLDPDAVFCPSCSTPVSANATINCPKCGKLISAGSKFCKYCAFDFTQPIQAAQPSNVQTPAPIVNESATNIKENRKAFLAPAGAALALICFFLPWADISAFGTFKTSYTGAEFANLDGIFWLILLAAIAILAAFFFFRSQKQVAKSRPVVIISSLLGIGLILFKAYDYTHKTNSYLYFRSVDNGLEVQLGAIGALLGFALALVGSMFLKPASFSAGIQNQGDESAITRTGMKQNIAGMLCYAGLGLFALTFITFIVAIIFLMIDPHKKNQFVRFHAFQSIIFNFLGLFLYWTLGRTFRTSGGHEIVLGTVFLAGLFSMYKAYKNKMFKLPLIGNLAMKLAMRDRNTASGLDGEF